MSKLRSNSAMALTMCKSNLPLGVDVSNGSLVETKAIPSFCTFPARTR
jgi:hypothetical protein